MEDRDILQFKEFSGSNSARATPVSIPNTEVKTRHADDTARETVWESRSPPDLKKRNPSSRGFLFLLKKFFFVLTETNVCDTVQILAAMRQVRSLKTKQQVSNSLCQGSKFENFS